MQIWAFNWGVFWAIIAAFAVIWIYVRKFAVKFGELIASHSERQAELLERIAEGVELGR